MANTVFYYNMERRELCDSKAICLNIRPQLAYGEKPTWVIMLIKTNGYAWDTTGITAWRASVAFDFDTATPVACRTVAADITSDRAMVTVPIDTNTTEFLAAVNGNEKTNGWFELAGYDSNGVRVAYLIFEITGRMVMDPDTNTASTTALTSEYMNTTQLYALLRATTEVEFNTTTTGSGHSSQTSSDLYYRFRNAEAAGNWSDWIMLPTVASPAVTWSYITGKPTLQISGQVITIGTNSVTVPAAYTLPTASTTTIGGVKVDGITVTINNGVISAAAPAQLQADWNQTNTAALDFIKNKPTIPAAVTSLAWSAITDKPTLQISGQVITIGSNSITVPTSSGGSSAASGITITDSGSYFTGTTVEAALQEIGAVLDGLEATMEAI